MTDFLPAMKKYIQILRDLGLVTIHPAAAYSLMDTYQMGEGHIPEWKQADGSSMVMLPCSFSYCLFKITSY